MSIGRVAPPPAPRRIRMAEVSADMLISIWRGKALHRCINVPNDAICVGVNVNVERRLIQLAIESGSYDLVDSSDVMTALKVMFESQP